MKLVEPENVSVHVCNNNSTFNRVTLLIYTAELEKQTLT